MSSLKSEVEALRREVAELRAGVEALQSRPQWPSEHEQPWERISDKLKQDLARIGQPAGIATVRAVVLDWGHDKRRQSSDYSQWTDAAELPSAQDLMDMLSRLVSHPLALRVQHKLVEHLFDGPPMVLALPKAELAAALGVGEVELEKALLPLVADETLRWHKTAAGEECYELLRCEPFLHLLALVQRK